MSKFKGKYRSESHRLKDWDYCTPGGFYITINTKDRQHFFGEIRSEIMRLSSVGQLVVEKIRYIPIRHLHARIDEFIILPDHIHLIVHLQIMDENMDTRRCAPRGVSTGVSSNEFHLTMRKDYALCCFMDCKAIQIALQRGLIRFWRLSLNFFPC